MKASDIILKFGFIDKVVSRRNIVYIQASVCYDKMNDLVSNLQDNPSTKVVCDYKNKCFQITHSLENFGSENITLFIKD